MTQFTLVPYKHECQDSRVTHQMRGLAHEIHALITESGDVTKDDFVMGFCDRIFKPRRSVSVYIRISDNVDSVAVHKKITRFLNKQSLKPRIELREVGS